MLSKHILMRSLCQAWEWPPLVSHCQVRSGHGNLDNAISGHSGHKVGSRENRAKESGWRRLNADHWQRRNRDRAQDPVAAPVVGSYSLIGFQPESRRFADRMSAGINQHLTQPASRHYCETSFKSPICLVGKVRVWQTGAWKRHPWKFTVASWRCKSA